MKKNEIGSVIIIGCKLLLICAIVAGVVSFVYALTAERYEENIQKTKNEAIEAIFNVEGLTFVEMTAEGIEEPVYKVYNGEVLVGYCVEVASSGFGGDIRLMVGYTADTSVLGVRVISHAETPGLGSKVAEDGFLSRFVGSVDSVTLGDEIDAISGATISSRAVTEGVNRAFAVLQSVLSENGGAIR